MRHRRLAARQAEARNLFYKMNSVKRPKHAADAFRLTSGESRTQEELTLYLVKPEAMASALRIRQRISAAGLAVEEIQQRRLLMRDVQALYGELPSDILQASAYFLIGPLVEVAVLSGIDSVQRLLKLAGDKTDPSQCREGTLRFDYGIHEPTIWLSTPYYLNAVHRATSTAEATIQIRHFFERL